MTLWKVSSERLNDPRVSLKLKRLFDVVIAEWPFPLWEFQIGPDGAYRTEEMQRALVKKGSKVTRTMNSKHRQGKAIDIALYWAGTEKAIWDRPSYCVVFGYIYSIADQMEISIGWGGDWNRNWSILEKENWEEDLVHYELV